MDYARKRTLIGRCVRVDVHHGAHGTEEVPAHARHGGEQALEAVERIVEERANASAAASVRAEETGEEEHWRVVVHVIGHLRNRDDTETELLTFHLEVSLSLTHANNGCDSRS